MRRIIFLFMILLPIVGLANQTEYGPTTRADQLWQIAIAVRPNASVSIEQTMAAIFNANPQAFADHNVHKLLPGMKLTVPAVDVIKQISPAVAEQLVSKASEAKPVKKSANGVKDSKILQQVMQQITDVKSQYDSVGKTLITFDAQYQDSLQNLTTQVAVLQNQMQQLEQQLTTVNQQLAQKAQPGKIEEWFAPYINYLQEKLGVVGFKIFLAIVIIILLLLIWWACPCRRSRKKCPKPTKINREVDEDTETEYDFMGSQEGIPAKLDLARAYIDMGDDEAARKVLSEIKEKGNDEQQQEADDLLKKL